MDSLAQTISPPRAPNKHSIIPIHASDRGSFKKCRRRWDWTSPMRHNLTPRVEETGVVFPLWFGSGVHWALSQYYDPALQRDPLETFKTWYELQWNGGIVAEDWLDTTYDRKATEVQVGTATGHDGVLGMPHTKMYMVKGLSDIVADPDVEEFELHRELGIGMLTYYKEYIQAHDNFDVITAEHTFSVPIYDFKNDCELRMLDPRDGNEKAVHLRGTQDAIIQDRETGKYGILEHKTAVSISEDYFAKLDKDEQCTTYMHAAQVEARINDLPYTKIDYTLYNGLRKAYPKFPTITSRGNISIDRQKESTTKEMLMQAIENLGMIDHWQGDEKLANYVAYVEEMGESQFIQRNMVYRNRAELASCGERVYMEAMDMLAPNVSIYPNPTGDYSCLRCPLRAPCIAKDDGSDYQMMLDDMFESNWTR